VMNHQKLNDPRQLTDVMVLKRAKKRMLWQAGLAVLMVVLIMVVLFATTAAWYTNVVKTSGLTFDVSSWGFKGEVALLNETIEAAPGDEGTIELTAQSQGDEATAVSVNITKEQMDREIQKRLYFYVDTAKYKNDEWMDRVYLSNADSYTYTLFSRGSLLLTDAVYNDALLKWHWVRDVLGYYVRGTLNEDGTVEIEEYLRPIEYDYDAATTTFNFESYVVEDEDGTPSMVTYDTITTVDGKTTLSEFLTELSKTDGYPGTIDPTVGVTDEGYYPVAVDAVPDEYGDYAAGATGVWAYLCTYEEIKSNSVYDTMLGQMKIEGALSDTEMAALAQPPYVAGLTITAQNSVLNPIEVTTPQGLLDALDAAGTAKVPAVIRLADDITLTSALTLAAGEDVLLDLNGKTLTVPTGTYNDKAGGIQPAEGSALTMINGTLAGTGGGHALTLRGAEVTLNQVTFTGVACALRVEDDKTEDASDSRIRLVACKIGTALEPLSDEAIYVYGNGTASARATQLIVENSEVYSNYIGIMGNGTTSGDGQWGTDIQIINSVVSGRWAGVYQPQKDSTLTISRESVVLGYTGIAIKGGSVSIVDSTVSGTGDVANPPAPAVSGFTDTGDAIYIEANYGYEILLDIGVSESDTYISSANGFPVQVYEPDAENVSVKIHAGHFNSNSEEHAEHLAEHLAEYIADGSEGAWITDADGKNSWYTVGVVATESSEEEPEEPAYLMSFADDELSSEKKPVEEDVVVGDEVVEDESVEDSTPTQTPSGESPAETPSTEEPVEGTTPEENPAEGTEPETPEAGTPSTEEPSEGTTPEENPAEGTEPETPETGTPSTEEPSEGTTPEENPAEGTEPETSGTGTPSTEEPSVETSSEETTSEETVTEETETETTAMEETGSEETSSEPDPSEVA